MYSTIYIFIFIHIFDNKIKDRKSGLFSMQLSGTLSNQVLLVDGQTEPQAQGLRRLAAQQHAAHEYFEIVHYGAEFRIN